MQQAHELDVIDRSVNTSQQPLSQLTFYCQEEKKITYKRWKTNYSWNIVNWQEVKCIRLLVQKATFKKNNKKLNPWRLLLHLLLLISENVCVSRVRKRDEGRVQLNLGNGAHSTLCSDTNGAIYRLPAPWHCALGLLKSGISNIR